MSFRVAYLTPRIKATLKSARNRAWIVAASLMRRTLTGVVTSIGGDHVGAFGSLEAIAEEKGKLVAALPADGTAILNADDSLVMAMRARSLARVVWTVPGFPKTPFLERMGS